MEFSEQLASIQGALVSLQKKEGILQELSMKNKDHIPKIQRVVEALKNIVFSDSNKTEDEDDRLRKCTLFLIFNCDLETQEWLKDDENSGHLVDCASTLSKDLLVEIVGELSLLKYLSEAVILCPAFLSSELLEVVLAKTETSTPSQTMNFSAEMAKATYIKLIASLTSGCGENKAGMIDCIQSKLFSHFQKLLNILENPPTMAVSGMTQTSMYDQAGFLIRHVLSLVNACLEYFIQHKEHSKLYSQDVLEIYSITVDYDYTSWETKQDTREKDLIKELHDKLFSTCIHVISCVTCDLWMYFAECDSVLGGERSLQNDLAEAMYICLENINTVKMRGVESSYFQDLTMMLKSMAVKPRDEDDEIKEADLSVILENVSNKEKTQKKWFKAMFKFSDLLSNKECVDCIQSNLQFIEDEEVDVILKQTISHLSGAKEGENCDYLKLLSLDCLQRLPLKSQLEIMNTYLSKYNISLLLSTDRFSAEMTETFNKAVNVENKMDDKFYSDFIRLSLQNPRELMKKLIMEALTSKQQLMLIVNILKMLWPLSLVPVQCLSDGTVLPARAEDVLEKADVWNLPLSCLYHVILDHELTDSEQDNCIQFIATLVNESVIDEDKFIRLCMLPGLHSHVVAKDWKYVALWLLILQMFLDGTVKKENLMSDVILLLSLAEILEMQKRQTSFLTFSSKAMEVYERALNLVDLILPRVMEKDETLGSSTSGMTAKNNCMSWLKAQLICLSPRMLFYFGDLWYSCGSEVPVLADLEVKLLHLGSMKFPTEGKKEEYQRDDFLLALFKILPTSTSKEWKSIMHNISLLVADLPPDTTSESFGLNLLVDVILILCSTVTTGENLSEKELECANSCVDQCIRNFALIIKEMMQENDLYPNLGPLMFQKCVQVREHMPPVVKESCSGILLNILIDIVNVMRESLTTEGDGVMKEFIISVIKVTDRETRLILARKLLEVLDV